MAVLLLALPVVRADDKKADDKKPPSPQERYEAVLRDFGTQAQQIFAEARKVKGDDQRKLFEKYTALRQETGAKMLAIADDNPKDPVAADALFWVLGNVLSGPIHQKASAKITALVAEMPLKQL